MKKLVIRKEDLRHNFNTLQQICGKSQIIPVLKGNGYGLDIVMLANFLIENGVTMFAVSELSEAMALRNAGIEADILLLSPTSIKEEAEVIVKNNIICSIGSIECARVMSEAGESVRAHIKIDTGFGRYGFMPGDIEKIAPVLKEFSNIEYCGVFSHFSNSFDKKDSYVKAQIEVFLKCVTVLNENGINPEMKHIANSCAALLYSDTRLDAVRIGSALLGRLVIPNQYNLKRIAHLSCNISEVKEVPKGHNIGYANTYKTKSISKIAVVPIGYMDGFGVEKSRDTFRPIDILRYMYQDFRSLGKRYTAIINGKAVPIIGRISMYNIILDVTGFDAKIGDEVMLECNPILIDSKITREYQ